MTIKPYKTDYRIRGKVLDTVFTDDVYARKGDDSEEDIIRNITYSYAEGNLSCDCNKVLLVSPLDADQELSGGDTIPYQELFLITPDGEKIDLLTLGYFKKD